MKFTDFLLGKKLVNYLNSISNIDRAISDVEVEKISREIKEATRNRIIFWMSIMGGTVQVINFICTYLFLK